MGVVAIRRKGIDLDKTTKPYKETDQMVCGSPGPCLLVGKAAEEFSSPTLTDSYNGGRWYVCYFTGQCLSNLHSCHTSEIEAKSDFTAHEDFFSALYAPVRSSGPTGQASANTFFTQPLL